MFLTEFVPSEDDVRIIFETAINNPKYNGFREGIIDPIIAKLSTPEGRKKYVGYGDDFLAANSDMLAKEYPTKAVTFPKRYVDDIITLFGFTLSSLKEEVTKVAKSVNDSASFKTIINTPTNVIHTIALFYSDMIEVFLGLEELSQFNIFGNQATVENVLFHDIYDLESKI